MREFEEGAALMVSPWLTPFAEVSELNVVDIFDATAYTPHHSPAATSNPSSSSFIFMLLLLLLQI
jgi:hypothetical protein